jgi:hypothetical protein
MQRRFKQKLFVGIAVAAIAVGGTMTAVAATGHDGAGKTRSARASARRGGGLELATAASYLGLSAAQINSDLQSGQTLAQIANATSGKSAAGLIEALVAARKARLTAAIAKLPQRVTAEVNRPIGPLSPPARSARAHHGRGHHGANLVAAQTYLAFAASSYLGVSAQQLQSELQSGKSLAQLANATPGKSEAGLIAALVKAKQEKVKAAAAAGLLTQARENVLLAAVETRVKALVKRTF